MTGLTYKDNFSRVFDYTGDVEAFVIPKNATMLHIWAIGAGGNGGAGASRAAGTAGGGGGGGATGAIVTILVPTRFLPPILYIIVGKGGGTIADGFTKVMFRRGDALNNIVADSLFLANAGNNAVAGSSISAGTAGTVTSYNLQNNAYAGLSTLTITAGQAGEAGGAITGASGLNKNPAFTFGMPFSGGAGGAGCTSADFSGGSIIPNSNAQQQLGITLAGGAVGGGNGLNGLQFDEPFTCYGGSGGGSNNSGVGGKGGDGAIGCGGGGGGAGVTGGAGGRGGNGRVVITWF
jgi:hypothetical protein